MNNKKRRIGNINKVLVSAIDINNFDVSELNYQYHAGKTFAYTSLHTCDDKVPTYRLTGGGYINTSFGVQSTAYATNITASINDKHDDQELREMAHRIWSLGDSNVEEKNVFGHAGVEKKLLFLPGRKEKEIVMDFNKNGAMIANNEEIPVETWPANFKMTMVSASDASKPNARLPQTVMRSIDGLIIKNPKELAGKRWTELVFAVPTIYFKADGNARESCAGMSKKLIEIIIA